MVADHRFWVVARLYYWHVPWVAVVVVVVVVALAVVVVWVAVVVSVWVAVPTFWGAVVFVVDAVSVVRVLA